MLCKAIPKYGGPGGCSESAPITADRADAQSFEFLTEHVG
jgi:hypothetical protein